MFGMQTALSVLTINLPFSSAKVLEMNMTLTALNAAALVALVAFHFQGAGVNEQVSAQAVQPHHSVRQTPQLAVMTDKRANAAMLTNDAEETLQIPRGEERWVF
jgi:uncharacterized membrane protein